MAERIVFEGELDLEHLNLIKALSAREMYVEELAQIAERDERIVITGADVGAGGKIGEFKEKYPDRFIDTGIAEADQVGVSAGMALNGKIVYLAGFGPFLALRALDQVHTDVAYQNIPVRIVNTHSGLTSGGGPTHYNIMDLAVMRDLPNMTVIAPSDSAQCIKAIRATLEYPGPVCFRIARGAEPAVYTTQDYDYEVGKAITALDGTDLTIIATGFETLATAAPAGAAAPAATAQDAAKAPAGSAPQFDGVPSTHKPFNTPFAPQPQAPAASQGEAAASGSEGDSKRLISDDDINDIDSILSFFKKRG